MNGAIGSSTGSQLSAAPDIPTTDEAGLAGLHVQARFGLWAPKGTPADATRALTSAVGDALADADVLRRLRGDLMLEPASAAQRTPEGLRAFQSAEIARWWPLVKSANIKYE